MDELIRGRLTEDGYILFIVSRDMLDLFKDAETEKSVELDYNNRTTLRIFFRGNDIEDKSSLYYGSSAARCVISSLFASGCCELWKEPIGVDNFKLYASNAFENYCSKKSVEEGLATKIKNLSVSESDVGRAMDDKWFKNMYETVDDKIRLRCGLRNVVAPKV